MRASRTTKAVDLVRLSTKAASSKSRKLSLEQQIFACKLLATGLSPTRVADRVRTELGVRATSQAIASYLKTRADEIAQYRKAWNEGVKDKVHLRFDGARLLERVHAYGLLISQLFREVCPMCNGTGTTSTMWKKERIAERCKTCKGRRWIIPKAAEAYELGDDVGMSVKRLAGEKPPPGCDLAVWDRMMVCLREIREEVGDAKPEQGSVAGDVEALARAAFLNELREQMAKNPSAFLELCRTKLVARRELVGTVDR